MSWRNPTSTSPPALSLRLSATSHPIIPAISATATSSPMMLTGCCHHDSTTTSSSSPPPAVVIGDVRQGVRRDLVRRVDPHVHHVSLPAPAVGSTAPGPRRPTMPR